VIEVATWSYSDPGMIPGVNLTEPKYRSSLPLNETFVAPQGEGPFLGRRSAFVRLGLCNLSCPGCDTARTWDRERFDLTYENPLTDVADILDTVTGYRAKLTIVTGGEPLIWQRTEAFVTLLAGLGELGAVHFETNGTIAPAMRTVMDADFFVVSPKVGPLASAKDTERKRIRHDALSSFAQLAAEGKAAFKFVCATAKDVTDVVLLCGRHDLDLSKVWVMPYGATAADVARVQPVITKAAVESGLNVTTRLHLIADTL